MENKEPNPWVNTNGCRIIVDCWCVGNLSYALIVYPNNVLHLQWLNINKC
jgi:hypothetical protein